MDEVIRTFEHAAPMELMDSEYQAVGNAAHGSRRVVAETRHCVETAQAGGGGGEDIREGGVWGKDGLCCRDVKLP